MKRLNSENIAGNVQLKKARLNFVNITGFVELKSAFNRKLIWYYRKNIENIFNYQDLFTLIRLELIAKLRAYSLANSIRYNLKIEATCSIPNAKNSSQNRAFKTPAKELFLVGDIESMVDKDFTKLISEEDEYMGRGSEFTL